MKKIIVMIVFVLFFNPIQSFCKPIFNILDSECIVFIQGSKLASNISAPLEVFLNTVNKANLQVWYIKSDQYSRIKFNNNTYLELDNYPDNVSNIFLYKKGRSYYNVDLNDENLDLKVNKYFGRQVFPVFDKRSKIIYETKVCSKCILRRTGRNTCRNDALRHALASFCGGFDSADRGTGAEGKSAEIQWLPYLGYPRLDA